ncbi:uncharacterized protein C8R40DRAFT_1070290 [Lentinula edodes]|nr:uncharacterized protein C8R40DRAFT_1070290 [Lentinula edodes]KAH7874135.1 hypothetical protein C8R40DRAFT_1070290 [Lentinula edodes]
MCNNRRIRYKRQWDVDSFFNSGFRVWKVLNPDVYRRSWVDAYEKALEPFTKKKGIDWELQMTNEDPLLWNANGMRVPPFLSEDYMKWKELNRAVDWESPADALKSNQ